MIEGVGGTVLGGQVKGIKYVHLGFETAKMGLDNHLQLFGYINTKGGKMLFGVEQRNIIT